jgi:hypothetical protein
VVPLSELLFQLNKVFLLMCLSSVTVLTTAFTGLMQHGAANDVVRRNVFPVVVVETSSGQTAGSVGPSTLSTATCDEILNVDVSDFFEL